MIFTEFKSRPYLCYIYIWVSTHWTCPRLTLDTLQLDWEIDVSSSFFVSMDRFTGTDDRLRRFLGCTSQRDAGDRFSGSVLVDTSDDAADGGCSGGGGDEGDVDSYMARCQVSDRISNKFNRLTTSSNSFSCKDAKHTHTHTHTHKHTHTHTHTHTWIQ